MEGMLETEARRLERQLELERRQSRRNTLQLISAVAQWIALLACLVYISVGFLHHPTPPRSDWISVEVTDYVTKEKRFNLSHHSGTMKIRNLSIPIICDGFYLVSLKGRIKSAPSQRNTSLTLQVCKRLEEPILEVEVTKDEMIDLVTVSEIQYKDKVYLAANRDAIYEDLTLNLFLLSTSPYCSEDMEKM